MTASTATVAPSGVTAVLDRAAAAVAAQESAAVDLLVAAADWADAHAVSDPFEASGWEDKKLYSEGVSLLAGPGAPMTAEFAPIELAGRLAWSIEAAKALIADALEMKHRLPRLWALVLEQVVPVRVARHIASCTTDLTLEAANQADRIVCADPTRASKVKAERLVDEIRLWFDPDRALDDEQRALSTRDIWKHPGRTPATTEMTFILETPDAKALDQSLSAMAGILKGLGDPDDLQTRRAKAAGILANPQRAVALINGADHTPHPQPATVFVHINQNSLTRTLDGTGPAVIEQLGAASTDLIRDWLKDSTVTIRPLLDLNRTDTVAQHDPPEWLRDLVIHRDAHCIFPGCRRDSRTCDLDHIVAYDAGGPTAPDNLAPLCRTHHRAKTHAAYHYTRDPDGTYQWTLPHGDEVHVIPTSRKPTTP